MKIAIIGAGIAGIMASNYFSRRGFHTQIYEAGQTAMNHKGVLRFRNPEVGSILGCTLKKVNIQKAFISQGKFYYQPTVKMMNEYSIKTNGKILQRSVSNDTKDSDRYIFEYKKEEISAKAPIIFDCKFSGIEDGNLIFVKQIRKAEQFKVYFDFVINTIPLSSICEILNYEIKTDFCTSEIYEKIYKLSIDCEANQTIYLTDTSVPIYRMTLEGDRIIVESTKRIDNDFLKSFISNSFGIPEKFLSSKKDFNVKKLGKITPIDDTERRKAILYLTEEYNIFSLGRYAVWKSNLKADDLIMDLQKIELMMKLDKHRRDYSGVLYDNSN